MRAVVNSQVDAAHGIVVFEDTQSAALDIFFTSPVAAQLPNVMGALLTVGTLSLIPVFGRQNLARRPRVVEPPTG